MKVDENGQFWDQCECLGYRKYVMRDSGRVPIGGCGACDKIRSLQRLLDGGVRVRTGSDVTGDPDNLRRRLESAEEEVERLKGLLKHANGQGDSAVFLKIRKLREDAFIPMQATPGAAGFDLHAIEDAVVYKHQPTLVKTGLAVEIPPGYELQIRPRSGLAFKKGLTVLNSPGTIDADYRGEVGVILSNFGSYDSCYTVKKGDRIAQAVICPVPKVQILEVDELSDTGRGTGGFGSTGS